jgi:hypothetical protein
MGAGYGGCEKGCEEDPADGARGGGVDEAPALLILRGATVLASGSEPGGLEKKSSSSGLPCFWDMAMVLQLADSSAMSSAC